jgi:phosphoribosylglycinamide formyltransferase-1
MKRIVILISGRGSNMQAIVQAARQQAWPLRIAGVIASKPGCAGLAWAIDQGLATAELDHRDHADRAAFDAALATQIEALAVADGADPAQGPDLVVLAGFMRILSEGFVTRYAGRLINIHPSLLPAFAGLHTHRRALEAGCKLAGATVHWVTPTLDHGPVICQVSVPVQAGDDAQRLGERVLAAEHQAYPRAIRWWLAGRLHTDEQGIVHQLDGEPQGWFVPA